MKKVIFIISYIFFAMSCVNYSSVLNDFGLHSYYLAINVKYNNETAPIVIKNANFYRLIENDTLSRKEYVEAVGTIIKSNSFYQISDSSLFQKLQKYKVDMDLCEDFGSDKEGLVDTFFDKNKVQKSALTEEEEKCLIYKMFHLGVFLKNDDETGYLYVPR